MFEVKTKKHLKQNEKLEKMAWVPETALCDMLEHVSMLTEIVLRCISGFGSEIETPSLRARIKYLHNEYILFG